MPRNTSSGWTPTALLMTRGPTTLITTCWSTLSSTSTIQNEPGFSKTAIESGSTSASGGPTNGISIKAVFTTAVRTIRSRPATDMIAAVPMAKISA
jgi:hypothetical protein